MESTQSVQGTPTPANQSPAPGTVNGQSQAQMSAGATSTEWTSGLNDELKGYVQNKGFKDPSAVLDSYRNLERLMGAPRERILKLPENMEDQVALNEIYSRLGRPESPEGYQIDVPKEGGDPEFAKWAKEMFHKQGLTKAQAAQIVKGWNEYTQGYQKSADERMQKAAIQQEGELKKAWGAAHDQNVNIAKRAAIEFGFKPNEIDAMESSFGYKRTMEIFHAIGSKLGEATFHSSNSPSSSFNGKLTPDAALQKVKNLQNDSEFMNKYLTGDKNALAEMERYMAMAYPTEY